MSSKKFNPFQDFQSHQIQRSYRKIFPAHYACRIADSNLTLLWNLLTDSFFKWVNSLTESCGVRVRVVFVHLIFIPNCKLKIKNSQSSFFNVWFLKNWKSQIYNLNKSKIENKSKYEVQIRFSKLGENGKRKVKFKSVFQRHAKTKNGHGTWIPFSHAVEKRLALKYTHSHGPDLAWLSEFGHHKENFAYESTCRSEVRLLTLIVMLWSSVLALTQDNFVSDVFFRIIFTVHQLGFDCVKRNRFLDSWNMSSKYL